MKKAGRTIQLLAISGSLRAASSNTTLLRATALLAPGGIEVSLCDKLGDLPHFNPDLEGAEPSVVKDFCAQVGAADGIIISSPEYAHGVPGVFELELVGGDEAEVGLGRLVRVVGHRRRQGYPCGVR